MKIKVVFEKNKWSLNNCWFVAMLLPREDWTVIEGWMAEVIERLPTNDVQLIRRINLQDV